MRSSSFPLSLLTFAAAIATATIAHAQAAPPAGATGVCKDGTYTTSASKSGACHGHQGVKEWLAAPAAPTAAAAPKTPAAPAASKASTTPAAPAAPVAQKAPPTPATPAAPATPASPKPPAHQSTANMTAAAGGGPGLVWFNSDSKVYHCPGSQYYGKTKQGSYMSEADAKAKGGHPDHNHPCTK